MTKMRGYSGGETGNSGGFFGFGQKTGGISYLVGLVMFVLHVTTNSKVVHVQDVAQK